MMRTRTASALVLACAVCVVESSCSAPDSGRATLTAKPTSNAGTTAEGGADGSTAGANGEGQGGGGGEEAGGASGKEPSGAGGEKPDGTAGAAPTGGAVAAGGSTPPPSTGGVETPPATGGVETPPATGGAAGPEGTGGSVRVDDCYIYCEKRAAAECTGLSLSVGECVDRACGVYINDLSPACVEAYATYYDCRLNNPDICVEDDCQNPALMDVCAPR